ncbi:glycosyltransferase family 1 protein [Emticicia sp. W12TSBA100-4]|uniref:glycosyltransferase family 4 protein n=1 Tax=Emticicia sp. W12TSBA100-4 TaxID=3160965 RepID=UPI0033062ECA
MRIGIDARFALNERRGIGKYVLNLVHYLSKFDTKNDYYLYVDNFKGHECFPKVPNFHIKVVGGNYFLWEQIKLPFILLNDNIDIYHGTGNTIPLLYFGKTKFVVTIHDVMFFRKNTSGNLYQKIGKLYRQLFVPLSAWKSKKIITVSSFSKEDISKTLNISKNKICVTWQSIDDLFLNNEILAKKFNFEYLFALGAEDIRKNSLLIIEAFFEIRKKYNLKLIYAGFKNFKQSSTYRFAEEKNILNSIIFLEYINDLELVSYYKGAKIFLYPSTYEGFGVPPLESMSCGTPVITSNITSIPEICEDAVKYIFSFDKHELAKVCSELLDNPNEQSQLINNGRERLKKFSWAEMAGETLAIYNSL